MGCPQSRKQSSGHDPSHHHRREELHFVDEYGQPITVQVEERRGRGHLKRRGHYTVECSAQTERQWENLRAMGLVEREDVYRPGPFYGHMTVSPDVRYSTSDHMIMTPDLHPANGYLPSVSPDLLPASGYLPSVSYSLDHLDRLECQGPEGLSYQPNSESCLIGCYSAEEAEPNHFRRQTDYSPPWRPDHSLSYLPLSELDSGLGCGPGSPHHQMALSEAETDAVSSLPGHTPSSPGSSPSSESLLSSEPSDSGFHSVSTGEFRRFHKMHSSSAHRHATPHRTGRGHSPRDQRGRWDLESIPETTQMSQADGPRSSLCIVGNSVTATVQFHRAERSPTLPRHPPPSSPSMGCRTEPCQRRALWLAQQQQQVGGTIEAPGRSRTMMDLSDGGRPRRASHPNTSQTNPMRAGQPGTPPASLGPRSRASYPNNCTPKNGCHPATLRGGPAALRPPGERSPDEWGLRERGREESPLAKRPGSGSSAASECRGFQTLGGHTGNPKSCPAPLYSTLGGIPRSPRSPPSPRSRLTSQKAVRNQLLRARASRLARERSEVTTDEEVRGGGGGGGERDRGEEEEEDEGRWAGRYWSRNERRRHLALSRQHRERRGGGGGLEDGHGCSSQTVLELSHRKQNRLRNSKLLDDWTTVEELLTHGTRVEGDSQLCPSPLLSVTTV